MVGTAAAATETRGKRLDTALAAACSHPLRVKVRAILGARVASPSQIARQLKVDVQKAGYHVEKLAEADLVEEIGSRPVRGATEHFYRAVQLTEVTDEQEAELPQAERTNLQETTVALYTADAANAIQTGTLLGRNDHHLTRHSMSVDWQGWQEAGEAYMELYERMNQIKAESAERIGKSDEMSMDSLSFLSLFEMPPAKSS